MDAGGNGSGQSGEGWAGSGYQKKEAHRRWEIVQKVRKYMASRRWGIGPVAESYQKMGGRKGMVIKGPAARQGMCEKRGWW